MQSIYDWKHSICQSYDSKHYIWHLWRWLENVRIQAEPSSCIIYGFTLLKYTINIYFYSALCQNDLDLFQQIRASILHIRLTCDYSTGSPSTKSHWVPSSHLTLETELTCNSLIWGRGAGGAGAFLKFKSKNAQCSMQWVPKRVLHIVWALYHVYIVVQVTMNMAEYGGQPTNVTFGPIIRGLKSDIFHWGKGSRKKLLFFWIFFQIRGGRGPYPIFFLRFWSI